MLNSVFDIYTHTCVHTHINMSMGPESIKKTMREMRGDEKAEENLS